MNRMPSVFVSHGSPSIALSDGEYRRFFRKQGVLILGSGGAPHDLDSAPDHPLDAPR